MTTLKPAPLGGADIRVTQYAGSSGDWNAFAHRCGASFRCAYESNAAWLVENLGVFRLRRLDICLHSQDGPKKIGQCAVGLGYRRRAFADRIQLLPEFEQCWGAAILAALENLGPGIYRYGSEWSLEPSRENNLSNLPVHVLQVQNVGIDFIDFGAWKDWDSYFASVSQNARRNARKAEKHFDGFTLSRNKGADPWRIAQMSWLRCRMFQRKRLNRSFLSLFVRSLARSMVIRDLTEQVSFRSGDKDIVTYRGIQFGADTFYLESAAQENNQGASWYLLLKMIREAWDRSGGQGRFLMGADSDDQKDQVSWQGLIRSRLQCRAIRMQASVIDFSYPGRTPTNEL